MKLAQQWLHYYQSRSDFVYEAWLNAAAQADGGGGQCYATWRACGYLASADGNIPGPLDAEEFEAALADDLREHGAPAVWEAFILQYNRLLHQRAADFDFDWSVEEMLGEGGFAKVFRGSHRRRGMFALKVVSKKVSPRKLAVLDAESRVWSTVPPHPAIVAFYGQYDLGDRTVLVTELCYGGCLMDRLLEADHFGEEHARGMARQIASAIWHLHSVGVAHRDLKPDNVLCTHVEPHLHGHVKLCDFGLASSFAVGEDAYLTKLAGTPEYLAPEVVRILQRRQKAKGMAARAGGNVGKALGHTGSYKTQHAAHYSERVDLWALGCVIYELLSGEPPFFSDDDDTLYSLILTRDPVFPDETFGLVSEQAKELLRALLHRDPQQRLAGDALKASAWWQLKDSPETPCPKLVHRKSRAERTFSMRGAITGHIEHFKRPAPGRICKSTCLQEVRVFSSLRSSGLAPFIAPLASESGSVATDSADSRSNVILEMVDLTFDKEVACCMDVKMGTRTFTEQEAEEQSSLMRAIEARHPLLCSRSPEPQPGEAVAAMPPEGLGLLRADLLEKMVRIDPNAPTARERQLGGVSKFRYMQVREQASTSAKLGFRVDGIRLADEIEGAVPTAQELKQAADEAAVAEVLRAFCQGRSQLLHSFTAQIRQLREAFEADDVAAHHAFIRSSLLFTYSDVTNETSVHMIDFARCYHAERTLSHHTAWEPGNHEDGYLTGLNNLVRILEDLDAP